MARKKKTFDDSPLEREPRYYTKQSHMISNAYKRPYKDEQTGGIRKPSLLEIYKRKRMKDSIDLTTSTKRYEAHDEEMLSSDIDRHYERTYQAKETTGRQSHINFERESLLNKKHYETPLPTINFQRGSFKEPQAKQETHINFENNQHVAHPRAPLPTINFKRGSFKEPKTKQETYINFESNQHVAHPRAPLPTINFQTQKRENTKPSQTLPKIHFGPKLEFKKKQSDLVTIHFEEERTFKKAPDKSLPKLHFENTLIEKQSLNKIPKINFQSEHKEVKKVNGIPKINFQSEHKETKVVESIPKIHFRSEERPVRAKDSIPQIHFIHETRPFKKQAELPRIHFVIPQPVKKKQNDYTIHFTHESSLKPKKAQSNAATKISFSSYNKQNYKMTKPVSKAVTKITFPSIALAKRKTYKQVDHGVTKPHFSLKSKQAKQMLYNAHTPNKTKKTAYSFKQYETKSMGSLLKGNAMHDKLPLELDKSRTAKRIQREHSWFSVVIGIGVVGLLASLLFNVIQSAIMFGLLIILGIYGYWTSR